MWVLTILASLLAYTSGQGACDYYQQLQAGQSTTISSPNYPSSYPRPTTCRWIVSCPNAICRAVCDDILIPSSPQCAMDRLLISRTGDPQLNGADTFCGQGTTTVSSTGNQMSLGLITSANSSGGRFRCQVTSVTSTTPPTCSCGYKKTNRIVGGVATGINEFPMMAGIVDRSTNTIFCGATIIDKRYLLTAAHCLNGVNQNNIAIVVGEHDVTTGDSPATQVYAVADYLIHNQYSTINNDYDVALIYVSTDILFSDRVGPVCLPFKFSSSTFANTVATALGWGTLFFGGPTSNTLQKVDLNVISTSACQSLNTYPTARQFCTYTTGKDTCQLDSGGPLLYTDPATGLLFHMGVISFGEFCATTNRPGVNTRVTSILTWIVNNTPSANYCQK